MCDMTSTECSSGSFLGVEAPVAWVSANRWETLARSLSHEGIDPGALGPRVSPLNTRIVKQKAGQETWSDLRSRKVGLQSWEGPVSVRVRPCHLKSRPELGIQSLEVPKGSAGNRGGNWEARPPRSSVQPEWSWICSALSPVCMAWSSASWVGTLSPCCMSPRSHGGQ